jgi:hypothetical protein
MSRFSCQSHEFGWLAIRPQSIHDERLVHHDKKVRENPIKFSM